MATIFLAYKLLSNLGWAFWAGGGGVVDKLLHVPGLKNFISFVNTLR